MVMNTINLIIVPLSLAPGIIILYLLYRKAKASLDTTILIYFIGFIPGILTAALVEFVMQAVLAIACFGSDTPGTMGRGSAPNAAIVGTVNYYLFIFLMAYFVAGLVEESLKFFIAKVRSLSSSDLYTPYYDYLPSPSSSSATTKTCTARGVIVYMLAAALGFSSMENIIYGQYGSSAVSLVTVSLRIALSTPLHAVCAALTAMQIIKHDYVKQRHLSLIGIMNSRDAAAPYTGLSRLVRILSPAVAVHGSYDASVFLLSPPLSYIAAAVILTASCVALYYKAKWLGDLDLFVERSPLDTSIPFVGVPLLSPPPTAAMFPHYRDSTTTSNTHNGRGGYYGTVDDL